MLYLLPGMGANQKMYKDWQTNQRIMFIGWSEYNGEICFAQIAKALIKQYQITPADCIGGSSLGGMIAIEIDKILNNKQVILIGSARHPHEINTLLLKLSKLTKFMPVRFVQLFVGKINHLVLEMFVSTDPEFIKSTAYYFTQWQGYTGDSEKLIRIHGNKDLIIRCPQSLSEKIHIIEGGGHLIAMSHPAECKKIIENLPL